MIKLLKLLELPHVSRYKWRWVRRAMILLMMPQEIGRALYGVFYTASAWWKWDGTCSPNGTPQLKL